MTPGGCISSRNLCRIPIIPSVTFRTGNFEVLKTLPEARGINVRDKFIEFHAKHYSANRMKLVVLGREPLDVLQKWVVEFFSPIVNKKLPPNRWPGELPFREPDLGMQCFAKPVMDSRELNLYFPFIDEEFMFASQPSRCYPVCPGTPGIFDVQGLKNYPEIVKIFFQYITILRESPPQEWIFQEQKGMADVDFKFKQKTQPAVSPAESHGEIRQAASVSPNERRHAFTCPIRTSSSPPLEVEKKDVTEPALNPRVLRNDGIARTWWKKDDTFWVPRANVIVSLKTPLIYSCVENVKARLFSDLYAMRWKSTHTMRNSLAWNTVPVLNRMIVRERLTRGYNNWQLQSSYHQVGDYTTWLNAPERYFTVEEIAAELPSITVEDVRLFQKQILGRLFIEVYVLGNMYKKDALKMTDTVESILKPQPCLELSGLSFGRSSCREDDARARFRSAPYQGAAGLRCLQRTSSVLNNVRFPLPHPERDDSRIFGFPNRGFPQEIRGYTREDERDRFEGHKRSLVIRRLEKLQTWTKSRLATGHKSPASITTLSSGQIIGSFARARKSRGSGKRQEEAQKKADEEAPAGDIPSAISTAVKITDVRVFKANLPASSGARQVKGVSEYEIRNEVTQPCRTIRGPDPEEVGRNGPFRALCLRSPSLRGVPTLPVFL
ncbi:Metalloenzyme, LuxS/M16 peptidase-like protein [Fusarium solani]|uniref:Metalloenzyme, LuxS/M16 peptidase-like protein n=1 Tax=Fusarium solani TaxID=169388 RepID=A0A9P9JYG1_FUSSL|nr:Metalloenzyme, LuxS/M16 peptidase-like protein [Fusarium solani]KAH7237836.1 Metalloenzyme, LuxS/M16 peptidase-like protein [Fusarium solani]